MAGRERGDAWYYWRPKAGKIATHLALVLAVLFIASPIFFALIKSTQSTAQIQSYPPRFDIGTSLIENYSDAWQNYNLGRLMLNTLGVAGTVMIGKTVLALFAALALVYFDFRFKGLIFIFILVTLMMPVPVRVVPLFKLVSSLKWGDTFWALTVPFLASATGTFLFRQHFMSIPRSLVDAARVDGVGPFRFLWRILVPMSMNTIGALAVIEFVYLWNQYLWPLIIISSNDNQMIQMGVKRMTSSGPEGMVHWGISMAGVIITMLPPLILFILLQEQFMRGFALTEEK